MLRGIVRTAGRIVTDTWRSRLAGVWPLANCSVKLYHRVENFVKGAADHVAASLKSLLCFTVGRDLADDFEKYCKPLFH